ncbi:hypothetical protein [Sphingorhabdus sp.]|uniref:hypothetical protein n=1 Tax=Sphingorhabdus sp. TaxID=1902408 RepID=UPI00391AC430
MHNSLPHNPAPTMAMAIVVAALVAAGMMFVPVAVLEAITGPTGLSELIPAASAPMSDVARAFISYAAGAMTLGTLTVMLCWPDRRDHNMRTPKSEPNHRSQLGSDILGYLSTKLARGQKADAIRNLEDVAGFRSVDLNTDMPARRPLLASRDLPDLGDSPSGPKDICQTESFSELGSASFHMPIAEAAAEPVLQPSTMELVAQLDVAVAQRLQKLADTNAVVSGDSFEVTEAPADGGPAPQPHDVHLISTDNDRRPVLELVPSTSAKDDDADAALVAALATLHRMTANAR